MVTDYRTRLPTNEEKLLIARAEKAEAELAHMRQGREEAEESLAAYQAELAQARDKALEEAAGVVDGVRSIFDAPDRIRWAYVMDVLTDISNGIRALKRSQYITYSREWISSIKAR